MIIAKEKRANNIAEYVLYMWQVEDLIRANNFDIDLIQENIIDHFKQPENAQKDIRAWYENLIEMMRRENIERKGHFILISNTISEINDFHLKLLDSDDTKYQEIYNSTISGINEFRIKSGVSYANDIDVCFNGLYALLLLRLKKKDVSNETSRVLSSFGNMLAYLSARFRQFEKGELEL